MAETIDPNKLFPESLKPDILYFSFDEEEDGYVISRAESGVVASIETGKVDAPPAWKPGPGPAFGKALEFNYGSLPAFNEEWNHTISGNHLSIPDEPALRLTGQSFTLGAWIQVPEEADLTPRPYKKILNKGSFSAEYPGWGLQIHRREDVWYLVLQLVDEEGNQASTKCRGAMHGFTPGQWHHVAASFDAESKRLTLWFDGQEVFSGISPADVGESARPLVIGENGMSSYSNIPLVVDEVFIVSGVHDFLPVNR